MALTKKTLPDKCNNDKGDNVWGCCCQCRHLYELRSSPLLGASIMDCIGFVCFTPFEKGEDAVILNSKHGLCELFERAYNGK